MCAYSKLSQCCHCAHAAGDQPARGLSNHESGPLIAGRRDTSPHAPPYSALQSGLVRMLEILEQEIRICLGLLGVNTWAELDQSYLHLAPPVGTSEALGAFPLLTLEEISFY